MMPAVNTTARIRNDDLLIRFACFEMVGRTPWSARVPLDPLLASSNTPLLRLAVDRDVSRVDPRGQRDRERLAFGLLHSQQALPVLGEKLPVVEARGRRLVIAPGLHLAAQPVHPGRSLGIARVGRMVER